MKNSQRIPIAIIPSVKRFDMEPHQVDREFGKSARAPEQGPRRRSRTPESRATFCCWTTSKAQVLHL